MALWFENPQDASVPGIWAGSGKDDLLVSASWTWASEFWLVRAQKIHVLVPFSVDSAIDCLPKVLPVGGGSCYT